MLSFYKDFARYFLYLSGEIRKADVNTSFFHHVLYPCAKRYLNSKGVKATLVPYSLKTVDEAKKDELKKNYDIKGLGFFTNKLLNNKAGCTQINERIIKYLCYYEDFFDENKIDVIISSGDSRMPIECCIAVAKKRGIKIYFFEQGPFGTTIFDNSGVNANASFSGLCKFDYDLKIPDPFDLINNIKEKSEGDYWSNRKATIYEKFFDYWSILLLYPPKYTLVDIIPVELSTGEPIKSVFLQKIDKLFKKAKVNNNCENADKYIALILQVPSDAQMILHSPLYKDSLSIVKDVVENAPLGYVIALREHPLYKNRYGSDLYDYVKSSENCYIDNKSSLSCFLERASVVVVNNSTVGLDALLIGKTVVVLGDSYYSNEEVVYKLDNSSNIGDILSFSINNQICKTKIKNYIYWLVSCNLIPGHYRDSNLYNASYVIEKLNGSR